MARILITSGPTRQYLDPVRYLTNGSSGRMGAALAQAALDAGHEVTIVSGPVQVEYPAAAKTDFGRFHRGNARRLLRRFSSLRRGDRGRGPQRLSAAACPNAKDRQDRPAAGLGAGRNTGRHRHVGRDEKAGPMAGRFRPGNPRPAHSRLGETGKEKLRLDGPEWSRGDGFPKQRGRNHRSPRTPAEIPGGLQGASRQRHPSGHPKTP